MESKEFIGYVNKDWFKNLKWYDSNRGTSNLPINTKRLYLATLWDYDIPNSVKIKLTMEVINGKEDSS